MERDLEHYFVSTCTAHGAVWVLKLFPFVRGIPDRLVLIPPGRCVFVELKDGRRGKLSAAQKFVHTRLRANGFSVYVIRNREEVRAFIEREFDGIPANSGTVDS